MPFQEAPRSTHPAGATGPSPTPSGAGSSWALATLVVLVLVSGILGLDAQPVSGQAASRGDTAAVSEVLDAFHESASRADGDAYFGLFAEDGVFIGTDPGERWTVAAFRAYARPYFERGQGWTYVPFDRHVGISGDGSTAWFDEMLRNEGLGLTRGTGVLVQEDGGWKVAQYHLTIPVPNEVAGDVVEMIRAGEQP